MARAAMVPALAIGFNWKRATGRNVKAGPPAAPGTTVDEITEAVPEQRIVYDWRYKGYPGVGKVTFEVFEEGSGSRLRVTNEGIESFPKDIPEFAPESCKEGWKYLIQGNLKNYLAA